MSAWERDTLFNRVQYDNDDKKITVEIKRINKCMVCGMGEEMTRMWGLEIYKTFDTRPYNRNTERCWHCFNYIHNYKWMDKKDWQQLRLKIVMYEDHAKCYRV